MLGPLGTLRGPRVDYGFHSTWSYHVHFFTSLSIAPPHSESLNTLLAQSLSWFFLLVTEPSILQYRNMCWGWWSCGLVPARGGAGVGGGGCSGGFANAGNSARQHHVAAAVLASVAVQQSQSQSAAAAAAAAEIAVPASNSNTSNNKTTTSCCFGRGRRTGAGPVVPVVLGALGRRKRSYTVPPQSL